MIDVSDLHREARQSRRRREQAEALLGRMSGQEWPSIRLAATNLAPTTELVEAILSLARRRRFECPRDYLNWAELGRDVSLRITGPLASDARASAWAETANALRLLGRLCEAARAMATARRELLEWSGDPLVGADIASLDAALLTALGQEIDAWHRLDTALSLYQASGQRDGMIRCRVQRAILWLEKDRAADGLEELRCAVMNWGHDDDPRLGLVLQHNIIQMTARLDPERAIRLWTRAAPSYRAWGTPVLCARAAWVAAQAHLVIGDPTEAKVLIRCARIILEAEDRSGELGVLLLDEAACHAALGDLDGARQSVATGVAILRSAGAPRQLLGALLAATSLNQAQTIQTLAALRKVTRGAIRRRPEWG